MPNWCSNTLSILAENSEAEHQLLDFKTKAVLVYEEKHWTGDEKTMLSLGQLYPEPEYENEGDWYDWRIHHWGTKWDVHAQLHCDSKEYLVYDFDSAWSPPIEWLKVIAKKYPLLKFTLKYDEPGMCFMGVTKARGDYFKDEYLEYGGSHE